MAFLDNSGDIILDAVLTDTGRFRMAKGDGSFKIVKFALGDDEINYRLYRNENNPSGVHPSGSAYYDLDILQSPVFEAFTNNTSVLKHNLLSIPRTDLLYLPVAKTNKDAKDKSSEQNTSLAINCIAVDQDTQDVLSAANLRGIQMGLNHSNDNYLRVDFGLDTTDLSPTAKYDSSLRETQLMVQMDNRLGNLVNVAKVSETYSFLDDDQVATYYLINPIEDAIVDLQKPYTADSVIAGPRQGKYRFRIGSSLDLQSSTHLFTKLGSTLTDPFSLTPATNFRYIDTSVRVIGATMGMSVDVPIRYLKKV